MGTMMLAGVASNIRFCGCTNVRSEPLKNARIELKMQLLYHSRLYFAAVGVVWYSGLSSSTL
jgi:hypothetical protein